MKKVLLVSILSVMVMVPAFAGNINVSGRAGYFTPMGGSSSMMYGLSASYAITENLSARGAVETTTYDVGGASRTFTPVSLDLIYSQTISGMLHPYVGAGVSYNTTTGGGSTTQTSGGQAEAGIRFEFNGFSAGLEYRYMLRDLSNANSGSSTSSGYMTGAFSQSFNL